MKVYLNFWILIFIFLSGSLRARADFHLSPELKIQSLDYADPLSPVVNQELWSVRGSFVANMKLDDSFKVKLAPIAQTDPTNKSTRETFFWDVPEGYIEYKAGSLALQVGENIYNWSGTDGYNPVDVVNARRYFDPIHAEKLGAPSITLKGGSPVFDFQLIYIPQQVKSQLPGENSRWLPRDIYVPSSSSTVLNLPSIFNYSYSNDQILDNALTGNYGAHLELHLDAVDFALMEFEGVSQVPAIIPSISGQIVQVGSTVIVDADQTIGLQPVYYRERVTGLTFVAPIKENIFRVAASYTQPISVGLDVPGWSYNGVVELEHNFSVGRGTLTLIPQFTYGQYQDSAGNEISSLSRIFDRAAMLGARYAPTETWSFLVTALYDFIAGDKFSDVEISHMFSDQFTFALSGEVFFGVSGSVLGSYQRNDRAFASISWHL